MGEHANELRLLWALGINALLLLAAARVRRRWGGDAGPAGRWLDLLVLWYAGQYAIVGVTGLLGVLTPVGVTVGAFALAATAIGATRGAAEAPSSRTFRDDVAFFAALGLVIAYVGASVYAARGLPALADDALTYHLPAAAAWLQERRIGVFETWFFNPANTYSPLAGSMFAAWLMAPFGSDVAARFMQAPAVVMVFAAAVTLAGRLGAGPVAAALLGVAVALCRPIVGQAILAKDDVFLAAFVLAAVASFGRTDRLAPWRIGLTLGLAAATKYTSVYVLLPLLVALPFARWTGAWWRSVAIASAVALVLAGPWFVRNAVLYGNPIFPLSVGPLEGMFSTTASPRLATAGGFWATFATGYFALGPGMLIAMLATWALAWAKAGSTVLADPLRRAVTYGPLLSLQIFCLTAPYAELRFVYGAIALAIVSAAMVPGRLGLAVVAGLAGVAVATGFPSTWVVEFLPVGVAGAMVGAGAVWLRRHRPRALAVSLLAAGGVAAAGTWVFWNAYIITLKPVGQAAWASRHGGLAQGWQVIDERAGATEPVAYTDTYLVYPLMGWRQTRPVVYVPVSPDVRRLSDLHPIGRRLHEETLLPAVVAATVRGADEAAWLDRLRATGVRFVLVGKAGHAGGVEMSWMRSRPEEFSVVLENEAAVVFERRSP